MEKKSRAYLKLLSEVVTDMRCKHELAKPKVRDVFIIIRGGSCRRSHGVDGN